MKHIFIILISFLLSNYQLFGNDKELRFAHISTSEGLSHFSVSCIVQDSKGFMWFGTLDGLNKYNGYDFTIFRPDPGYPNSISNNVIRSLLVDSRGFLWIGTEKGLNRYHPDQKNFTSYLKDPDNPNSLVHNFVNCIYEDEDSILWIGTKGGGVSRFDPIKETFTNYSYDPDAQNSLTDNIIHSIYQEKDIEKKIIWIGGDRGLNKINPITGEVKTIPTTAIDPTAKEEFAIMNIYKDKQNRFWLGTWNNGLVCYSPEKGFIKKYSNIQNDPAEPDIILDMQEASTGELWMGTRGSGLYKFNTTNEKFHQYESDPLNPKSINNNDIMSVYESKDGILWLGTKMAGINKTNLDAKQFINLKQNPYKTNTLNDKIVQAISEDHNGILWFGTRSGGINRYNPKTGKFNYFKHNNSKNSLINNNVLDILQDRDKNGKHFMWVATDGGFVDKFYPGSNKFIHYRYKLEDPDVIGSMYVYTLLKDNNGNIWAGSWGTFLGGLHKLDKKRDIFVNYIHEDDNMHTPSSNVILELYQDSKGIIWVGTKGGGLNKLIPSDDNPPGKFEYFQHDPADSTSISHDDIMVIMEDHNDILWIGTGGGGLNKFNRADGTFTHFTVDDGLPSNVIYGITEDINHHLWISTSAGLVRFNPLTGNIRKYDKQEGLPSDAFNLGAYCKTNTEKMYFGTIDGVTSFYPDSIKRNLHIPPIIITHFAVDKQTDCNNCNRPVTETNKIELPYALNDFSLEFAALDYTVPTKNQYAYKLEGYETAWNYTGAERRFAHYTNLPPGEYIFRVIGSNNDDVWNDAGTSIAIIVKPPFYMTTWFKIAVLLLIFIIIILWIRITIKRHRKLFEEETKETLFAKENQLRTLIDNIPDFIYIKDANCRFIVANKKLAAVTGAKSTEELEGKTDHHYYDKELAEQFYKDEKKIMETGKPMIGKAEPGKDEFGNDRVISTTKIPLKNSNGTVIGIVGIGRDITDVKEAEEKIAAQAESLQETNVQLEEKHEEIQQQKEEIEAQRDELQRVNASKDKFFSIIGHDLKNPFNAIISLSEHLSKSFKEMTDEEKLELIRLIYISSENAYDLLENLLQWSRSQTGRIDYKPDSIDLYKILNSNIDFLKVNAEKKHITLKSNIKENLIVHADKNMVNTIIRNLINNAIKFTEEKGNITIDHSIDGHYISISIKDDGIGMDESTKAKLFKIDEQHSENGTLGESGTGLGLIICDEFIRKNKGKINVESEKGKGSTFTVKLPRG